MNPVCTEAIIVAAYSIDAWQRRTERPVPLNVVLWNPVREILPELDRWLQDGEEVALATLFRVRGSAPRLPGARLSLTRAAGMAGSVSGGCVETDVYERALGVLDSGQADVATYGIADELAFEVGLSCGGSIDVLIERFRPDEAWSALREAAETQQPAVYLSAISPAGLLGRHLTLTTGGRAGSIDPAADEALISQAESLLVDGGSTVLTATLGEEQVEVFAEAFLPTPRVLIVGATHVAIPLSRMAREAGFRVIVIDARSIFATRERFPEADEVIRSWPKDALDRLGLDAYAYVVILSHDPKFDLPTLRRALRSPARYIGAMGSRSTHARRLAVLREEGFSDADLARVRAPIGLDIGAQTPEEIAVAILAEMVAARRGKQGKPLGAEALAHAGRR